MPPAAPNAERGILGRAKQVVVVVRSVGIIVPLSLSPGPPLIATGASHTHSSYYLGRELNYAVKYIRNILLSTTRRRGYEEIKQVFASSRTSTTL